MILIQILLSLSGAYLLVRGFLESRLLDGAIIETQMYVVLYTVGAILLLGGILLRPIIKGFKKSILFRILIIIVALAILFVFVVAGIIAIAPLTMKKADGSESLLLVLGAPVVNDQPSIILKSRAEKAAEWLKEHPDMYVVISGGKGGVKTEAETISDIILDTGVSDERMFLENNATTTDENFQYAKEYFSEVVDITKEPIAVLTNHFHIFRLHYYAERQGFSSVSYIPVPTPAAVRLLWYARETVLVIRFWFTGI